MKYRGFAGALSALILSGCVVTPYDYSDDDYRPRERARAECVDEAHDRGYRRVEVRNVRDRGRGEWEVALEGRESGRDVRLRCEYDARYRRARVTRTDR